MSSSLFRGEQRKETSYEEMAQMGEEAQRIWESSAFTEILDDIEYQLMQEWAETPPGAEGLAVREAVHAKILALTADLSAGFQRIINEGEYAKTVMEQRRVSVAPADT